MEFENLKLSKEEKQAVVEIFKNSRILLPFYKRLITNIKIDECFKLIENYLIEIEETMKKEIEA